jgi:hypothetical protein
MQNIVIQKILATASRLDIDANPNPRAIFEGLLSEVQVWATPEDHPDTPHWVKIAPKMIKGSFVKPCELVGAGKLQNTPEGLKIGIRLENKGSETDAFWLQDKMTHLVRLSGYNGSITFLDQDALDQEGNEAYIKELKSEKDGNKFVDLLKQRPKITLVDRIYEGLIIDGVCEIKVSGKTDPSKSYFLSYIGSRSPSGFSWGYAGSGAAESSMCVLVDALDEKITIDDLSRVTPKARKSVALKLYEKFKFDVIATLPMNLNWVLPGDVIIEWIKKNTVVCPECQGKDKTCWSCGGSGVSRI